MSTEITKHTPMQTALLGAALSILRDEGAAALTVRNVTARAGCSTTGIYTHFGGKQGLIEAIYLDGFESFDRHVSDCLAGGLTAAGLTAAGLTAAGLTTAGLTTAGEAYRAWALANPTHYLVMWGRAVPDFEPSEPARQRAYRSFEILVDAWRAAGAEQPLQAAYHAWATLHGYVMLELAGVTLATMEQRATMSDRAIAGLSASHR